jgi:hypothetical protein
MVTNVQRYLSAQLRSVVLLEGLLKKSDNRFRSRGECGRLAIIVAYTIGLKKGAVTAVFQNASGV